MQNVIVHCGCGIKTVRMVGTIHQTGHWDTYMWKAIKSGYILVDSGLDTWDISSCHWFPAGLESRQVIQASVNLMSWSVNETQAALVGMEDGMEDWT